MLINIIIWPNKLIFHLHYYGCILGLKGQNAFVRFPTNNHLFGGTALPAVLIVATNLRDAFLLSTNRAVDSVGHFSCNNPTWTVFQTNVFSSIFQIAVGSKSNLFGEKNPDHQNMRRRSLYSKFFYLLVDSFKWSAYRYIWMSSHKSSEPVFSSPIFNEGMFQFQAFGQRACMLWNFANQHPFYMGTKSWWPSRLWAK